MVLNIMKAMSTNFPMGIHSEGDLNHLWSIISDGVAENLSSKGIKYRSKIVYIASGDRVVHEPCPVDSINDCMLSLMSFINSNELTPLLRAIIAHFYYVYVHPMHDCNGRTARALQAILLEQYGYYDIKKLPIISTINKNLRSYYSSLLDSEGAVNGIVDISPFIEYILKIVLLSYSDYSVSDLSTMEQKLLSKIKISYSITVIKLLVY